jgi:D-aminopeptidase
VGAGTGTIAFGFKGGIGTASRRLPQMLGSWTVGVLVQTNFGGVLTMSGAPVGRELGCYAFREVLERDTETIKQRRRADSNRWWRFCRPLA